MHFINYFKGSGNVCLIVGWSFFSFHSTVWIIWWNWKWGKKKVRNCESFKKVGHYILFFSVHPQVLAASSAPQLGGQFRILNQSRMKKEEYRENLLIFKKETRGSSFEQSWIKNRPVNRPSLIKDRLGFLRTKYCKLKNPSSSNCSKSPRRYFIRIYLHVY